MCYLSRKQKTLTYFGFYRKENFMMKNKKEIIKKRTVMLVLVFVLSLNTLTGCGKKTKEESKSRKAQTESCTIEGDEETSESMLESEAQSMESKETQTEEETSEENSTEGSNSGKSSSLNNTSKDSGNEKGLGKESYKYLTGGASSMTSKEKELGKQIIKKIINNGMSDFDKVKAINDYMIKNVSYDTENYKKNSIPYESYTALGAMEKKVAVCAGYAKMFKILASCAGLEATYVSGDTPYGGHAWNQVKVDGKWYNIDVTWNDPDCETNKNGHYSCGCYQYFLLSNEDFNKKHTPSTKVNATGSSRDFEAYKQGCPYDVAAQYYKTQADFDKLVKEMIAANKTSIRIMTDGQNKKDMVSSALKKQGIYGKFKVDIKDEIRIYRETNEKIYKMTIEITLDGSSYTEAKKQKITSVDGAKKQLEASFKDYNLLKEGTEAEVKLYVSAGCVNDKNFAAELIRWAQYEKKMAFGISGYVRQVDSDIYELEVDFQPIGSTVYEMIYSTKDIEPAVKRMLQYGYKKISLRICAEDYKLTGSISEARSAFVDKFCNSLSEKYCLQLDYKGVDVENNNITIIYESKGHDVEDCRWEIEKEATCVSEGLEIRICRRCKKTGEQRAIPKNDNHSYYWDQKGDSRTQKCKSCSYVGITEVCYGGVWGYFDEAAAQEELMAINNQRANIKKTKSDYKGNVVEVFSPPALVVNEELIKLAKERLAVLNSTNFEGFIYDEYSVRYTPVSKYYQKDFASCADRYHEKYSEVGIICFMYDVNGDGSQFSKIYVEEFGLAE